MKAALFNPLLSAMLAAVSAGSLCATEWPNFRGSRFDGIADAPSLANAPSLDFRLLWRRELGSGYSSVTTQDGRGYTMASIGDSDYLVCFDLSSGGDLFRYRINARFLGRSGSHDGPTSTPAVDAEAVYALGPRGDLIALDNRNGQLLWSRSLPDDFQAHVPIYGFFDLPFGGWRVAGDSNRRP